MTLPEHPERARPEQDPSGKTPDRAGAGGNPRTAAGTCPHP